MKNAPLLLLLAFCIAAQPGSQPASTRALFDPHVFAAALTGTYEDEDSLLRMARDDAAPGFDQQFAITAAICNEWDGPFRLRDFAAWLHDNQLDTRVGITDFLGDSHDNRFAHRPKGFRKMAIYLVSKNPMLTHDDFAVIAVGEELSVDDITRVLQNPKGVGVGKDPIIYDVRAIAWPADMTNPRGEEK